MKSQFTLSTVAASIFSLVIAAAASAGTINVIVSDVDVSYSGSQGNGGAIFDVVSFAGGNLDKTESDRVASVTYELNGAAPPLSGGNNTISSTVESASWADIRIDGVGESLAKYALLEDIGMVAGGFGIDVFGDNGENIRVGLTAIDAIVSEGVFFFTGEGTILDQSLPFGIAFDETLPVVISYTATSLQFKRDKVQPWQVRRVL